MLVAHVIDRARAGARLSVDEVLALVTADGGDRELLFTAASALRDEGLALAGRPGVITYSRKVFVPLTTLCRDRCHYCIFVDTPGQLLKKNKPGTGFSKRWRRSRRTTSSRRPAS